MDTITTDCESWIGSTLIDRDDHKLGTIEAIYYEEQTGEPQWIAIKAGLLKNKHHFVPVAGAMLDEQAVRTPHDKDEVDDAPRIDAGEDLRDDEVVELYRHYGLSYDAAPAEDVIVEREIVMPATDRETQAQDEMLVATGHEHVVDPTAPMYDTQAEQDMRVATGRTEPERVR